MMSPRHRYFTTRDLVANGSSAPSDAVMAQLFELLSGRPCAVDVRYAWELFQEETHRPVLDAFLLAKAPFDLIEKTLGVAQAALTVYAHLFMDCAVVRNRLEALSFASSYEGPDHGRDLLRTVVTVGLEYLLWAHGGNVDIDPRAVVRRTMTDAYFRGLAHRGNAVTTATAKEAQKWWRMAIQNAQLLEKIDPRATRAAYEELRIALEAKDETLAVDKGPVSVDEMLH